MFVDFRSHVAVKEKRWGSTLSYKYRRGHVSCGDSTSYVKSYSPCMNWCVCVLLSALARGSQ